MKALNDTKEQVLTLPVGTKLVPKLGSNGKFRIFKTSNYHAIGNLEEVELVKEGRANATDWRNPQPVIKVRILKGWTNKKESGGYYSTKTATGELDKPGKYKVGKVIHVSPQAFTRIPIPISYEIY